MRQYIDTLQDVNGNALVGATVLVQNFIGGGNASIFSDNGLTPIVTSTVTTGADGQFSFYAADGDYNLVMSKNSTVFKTQSPVTLFDGAAQLTYADTGAANAYAVSNSTLEKALRVGLRASFLAANTNTGASTFAYNGLAAKSIVFPATTAVLSGTIIQGGIYSLEYDGTNWQLRNSLALANPFYAITAAETAAAVTGSITPATQVFPEGDIRRYGATQASADNHVAIQNALKVSGAGGNAAFIPATQGGSVGTSTGPWVITTQITVPASSSMYGAGAASMIFCSGCNGLQFANGAGETNTTVPTCFFRDFVLVGSNVSSSTFIGIQCNFALGVGAVIGVTFDNIGITSFQVGIYNRGFQYCSFKRCFTYNCAQGYQFVGQSVTNELEACSFIRGSSMVSSGGAGTAYGISGSTTAGETPQAAHIYGCNIYGFDHNIEATSVFEWQIEHCDISFAKTIGVNITTTQGGVWVRDNWIELQGGVASTFGVQINNLGAINYNDIHICGNHIVCDTPFAGSMGVYVGNPQFAVTVEDNAIFGFDIGVEVFATSSAVVRDNKIDIFTTVFSASSVAVTLNASPPNCTVGPNSIVNGNATTHPSFFAAATMANASANIGVANSAFFPVSTPVQFDATQNGAIAGVTYYVLTSAANVLTLAPAPGGTAIVWTGNAAVNIFEAPLPVVLAAGLTPTGFKLYANGSFIGTMTGYAANPTGRVDWVANGGMVSVNGNFNANLTGTSNSTSLAMLGLPSMLWPSQTQQCLAATLDNGTIAYGYVNISTGGVMNFHFSPGGANFTAAGLKGINTQPMTYLQS